MRKCCLVLHLSCLCVLDHVSYHHTKYHGTAPSAWYTNRSQYYSKGNWLGLSHGTDFSLSI